MSNRLLTENSPCLQLEYISTVVNEVTCTIYTVSQGTSAVIMSFLLVSWTLSLT